MIRPVLLLLSVLILPNQIAPTAPVEPVHPRYVVIDDQVRAQFAADWDEVNPAQHERAYCLAYVISERWGVPVYRVWAASRAGVIESTPTSIRYQCPVGPTITVAHSHPATTCLGGHLCVFGGSDAWECAPSETDRLELLRDGDAFALLQCDRHAILAYYPSSTP